MSSISKLWWLSGVEATFRIFEEVISTPHRLTSTTLSTGRSGQASQ
ncbi:hypothetical protein NYZ99_10515 [Maribacter litopenaei]|uniref:Uncharacterized protein n=1 Tax=Maribacter litopenaei TaxID=2976127 RepID=A0ABY5Y3R1_9FLAO|nr:hypothetical protein [Maribacter litopenaei]UWX53622.1 hypothetical protein NYZ99_10515 [Maribacter litopenaei]